MYDADNMAGLSQKEKDQLDKKLESLQVKICDAKQKYDDLLSQYSELFEKRYPEKKEDRIKDSLYQSYQKSHRSLEQILSYMAGEDPEDW